MDNKNNLMFRSYKVSAGIHSHYVHNVNKHILSNSMKNKIFHKIWQKIVFENARITRRLFYPIIYGLFN